MENGQKITDFSKNISFYIVFEKPNASNSTFLKILIKKILFLFGFSIFSHFIFTPLLRGVHKKCYCTFYMGGHPRVPPGRARFLNVPK